MGPTEYYVISFQGAKFGREVLPELCELADHNVIRVLDLIILERDDDGDLLMFELADLPEVAPQYDELEPDLGPWFSQDDIEQIGEAIAPSSRAAVMLVEHVWARTLGDAINRANGKLLVETQVPRELIDEVEPLIGATPAQFAHERRAA